MSKLMFKVGGTLAAGALIASTMAGAAFAGENSGGSVNITNICTATISQSNTTNVGVDATVISNTGGNSASGNTHGDVSITTGEASSSVSVVVGGSSNSATGPSCCGCLTPTDVSITGGGPKGSNTTNVITTSVTQKNKTKVGVDALVVSNTGKNKVNKNTKGSIDVLTGGAASSLDVTVGGSVNKSL